jgi:hypothetical protein
MGIIVQWVTDIKQRYTKTFMEETTINRVKGICRTLEKEEAKGSGKAS